MENTNNQKPTITDIFGPVIHSYSRAEAIEDGYLHPMNEICPDETRIFKFPICFSNTIVSQIEGENIKGWCHDITFMAVKGPGRMLNNSEKLFKVSLPVKKGAKRTKAVELLCIVGPGDNMEPVVTICYPSEK